MVGSELLVLDASVDVDVNLARSCLILSISRFFVSENCVAMTTKHKFIMKNDPIWNVKIFPD